MYLFLASTSDASCSLTEKIKSKMQGLASFLFQPQSSLLLIYLAFLYFLSLDPILFSYSLSSTIWSSIFNLFLSMVLLFSLKIGPRLTSQFNPHPEYQLNFPFTVTFLGRTAVSSALYTCHSCSLFTNIQVCVKKASLSSHKRLYNHFHTCHTVQTALTNS